MMKRISMHLNKMSISEFWILYWELNKVNNDSGVSHLGNGLMLRKF